MFSQVIFKVKHEIKKVLEQTKKPYVNKKTMQVWCVQEINIFSGNSLQLEAFGFDDRAYV